MIDVGAKPETERVAVASGQVRMAPATLRRIARGQVPKGDVLGVARVAALQAAKRTPELLPLCHPVRLTGIDVELRADAKRGVVRIAAEVRARDRTGVEMEALCAVAAAALCVYDMCKALDRGMTLEAIRLEEKSGGRSGVWIRPPPAAPKAPQGRPKAG
jgi:cyclic pyranopterin phosphate synthase